MFALELEVHLEHSSAFPTLARCEERSPLSASRLHSRAVADVLCGAVPATLPEHTPLSSRSGHQRLASDSGCRKDLSVGAKVH